MILKNSIKTPDGTILVSRHRHDYVSHNDTNGETYFIDGGNSYFRGSLNKVPAEDLSITTEDDFDLIREGFEWGSYGKNGK